MKPLYDRIWTPTPWTMREPLDWREPQTIRVELDKPTDEAFAVMALCPHLTFQVVAGDAKGLAEYLTTTTRTRYVSDWYTEESSRWFISEEIGNYAIRYCGRNGIDVPDHVRTFGKLAEFTGAIWRGNAWPLSNVHLGVRVQCQEDANTAIPNLLRCPAAVRFVVLGPKLGPVDMLNINLGRICRGKHAGKEHFANALSGFDDSVTPPVHSARHGISWLIIEGGDHFMHPDHVRSIRDQCVAAGVPFALRWGEWRPCDAAPTMAGESAYVSPNGQQYVKLGIPQCTLDGVEWDQRPEVGR